MKIFRLRLSIDWLLYLIPVLLTTAGIITIYSLTYFKSTVSLTWNQIVWAIFGVVLLVALTRFDYRNWRPASVYLYLLSLGLLLAILFFGKSTLGATRWLDFKIFQLQPAELTKIILVLFLAHIFSDRIGQIRFRDFALMGVVVALPVALMLRQPDLGTATILILVALGIFLFAKPPRWQLVMLFSGLGVMMIVGWFLLAPYQRARIETFLNPQADPFGSGYNVLQSIITVGSGGIWGRGLGHGPQSQLNFLPVAHTDFIFAGWAEAMGLVGVIVLLLLFVILLLRVVRVAEMAKDQYGMMVALGFGLLIGIQAFINIGMNVGLLPVTGVPLPFVSYGGTSLVANFALIGILQSIYLRHKKITF